MADMEYKEWNELRRKMAVEMFVMEATNMMIPAADARKTAERRMAEADAASAPEDQGKKSVQHWRGLEHSAGCALIALEQLGMRVIPESGRD